ncbi:MAG TPA: protein kinase, partial [Planctomycetota bacterium]|nr:protein kinase [Planctomycetota bacterium]
IVPVHDVGESAAGPYLVMDLVEGTTLQDMLDERGCLEPRETAVLIEKLARALAHAHEQGVLHRDMKPANVIMTPAGEPRITDFGLAKDLRETATLTETGSIVGTPGYMPPEQARGEATAFDPRFDVYSLGAILYECLTGEPPFVGASAVAILKRVASDEEPAPPSTKRRPLDKDLETICLHAIEKELDRRYATAKDLADDLARYLAHEPIHARPATRVERGRKWLRRNKKLAKALAFTIIIVGGAAAAETIALVHRLRDERDRAAERLEVAQQALDVLVYEVKRDLADVPGTRVRETRRRLLEQALGALDRLRADSESGVPASLRAAEAHRQIGAIALELGEASRAVAMDQLAVTGIRALSPPDEITLREALVDLGTAQAALGDTAGATASLEEALATAPATSKVRARALVALAGVLETKGELQKARRALEEAVKIERSALVLNRVASLARAQGDLAQALASYESALALLKAEEKEDAGSLRVRTALVDAGLGAGDVHADQGDREKARASYELAIAKGRELLAEDPKNATVALLVIDLMARTGDALRRDKDYGKSVDIYDDALALSRRFLGTSGASVPFREREARLLEATGESEHARKDLVAAKRAFDEEIALVREQLRLAPGNAIFLRALSVGQGKLALVLEDQGDRKSALKAFEEAATTQKQLLAEDPTNAAVRTELVVTTGITGEILEDDGDLEGAMRHYETAFNEGELLLAGDPTNVRVAQNQVGGAIRIALLLRRRGMGEKSLPWVERAISYQKQLVERGPQFQEKLDWLLKVREEFAPGR